MLNEGNNVRVVLLYTDNRPTKDDDDDCLVAVINTTSISRKPLSNFCFQLNEPDDEDEVFIVNVKLFFSVKDTQSMFQSRTSTCCALRLLEANRVTLPAFSPVVPQQSISQIVLFDKRKAVDKKVNTFDTLCVLTINRAKYFNNNNSWSLQNIHLQMNLNFTVSYTLGKSERHLTSDEAVIPV